MVEKNVQQIPDRENDEYAKAIGEMGRWQLFILTMLAVPIKIVLPGIHFGIVLIAPKTAFRCLERNSSDEVVNMTCYSDCGQYEYFSEFKNNIITEWDLICDRAWLANFTQTVCMFGVLIGSALFGFFADRYGRRPALIISGLLETCFSLATPFCTNYYIFVIIRFFLGFSTAGTMITSFVLLMEIFGPSKREFLATAFMLPLPAGHILMSVIVFYSNDWQDICLGAALPTLVFVTYAACIPESPKWLISVGRLEEAKTIMETAAEWNNLPVENVLSAVEIMTRKETTNRNEGKASFVDLIRLPSLRVKNFCSCVIWFLLGFSFYGLIQYFGQTNSNTTLSFALMGIAQFPGFFLSAFVSRLFGRRYAIAVFFITSAIGSGLLALPDEWYLTKLVAGAVGVGSGAAVYSIAYVYTPELFPTVARNMAMGASSTTNRVGSMIAPFVGALSSTGTWVPPAIFAVMPILAVVAVFCLPETRGKKLEDHLERID